VLDILVDVLNLTICYICIYTICIHYMLSILNMFANKKKHRPQINIILNGTNIEQVSHTKFLGVIIDENVT